MSSQASQTQSWFSGNGSIIRATLTGTGTATPSLSDIQLSCNSASSTGSRVLRYSYDEAGNILNIATITNSGTTNDTRDDAGWSSGDQINALNQITRQDVGGATWTFSYSSNGCLTSKTDGTNTWTYTWNDENRLTRV
ncbi:MAG: hypothetical protein WBO46_02805, partial [Caldilineaceae bacterium]